MTSSRTLVARLDNLGDVLLAGPAVRAAAAGGPVTVLTGPAGAAAASLLPDVDEVIIWDAPWVGFSPPPVDRRQLGALIDRLSGRFARAAILTSFHQSPLPLALLLRIAGVKEIAAVSVDYPGALLDHRVAYADHLHEVEQNLAVTSALGFPAPDDDRLAVHVPSVSLPRRPYVAVHPGASVPARAIPARLAGDIVRRLSDDGRRVVVTGGAAEAARLPLEGVVDLRGKTTLPRLAAILGGADAVVVGNTGPAHLAAATGTPVVSVFAPVVDPHRWRPWRVPAVVLGKADVPCSGCRARTCPLADQHCVSGLEADDVLGALASLLSSPRHVGAP